MLHYCVWCCDAAAEADDAAEIEGRCWEESCSEGRDDHWSGTHQHTEEVLSSDIGTQLLVSGEGYHDGEYSESDEHDDGTAQMLQPSVPDQWYIILFNC